MSGGLEPLLQVLKDPAAMSGMSDAGWDLMLRQAATAGLLGRLGALAEQRGLNDKLPAPARTRLHSALTLADQQHRAVVWELAQLSHALAALKGPVVLLKGAAYTAAGLAPAAGRLFSDIDILVPKTQLDATEAALMLDGWHGNRHDAYEQRYYREWMHELPPMTHIVRQTVLDLHHNILPETARIKTRPDLLLAAAHPLTDYPRFSIPCPTDQVLHSATHLFHEGEWEHGLRDLVDLDALLREYGRLPGFWTDLLGRAKTMGLGKPLFYGLRYCHRLLDTPIPQETMARCPQRPGPVAAWIMDRLFLPAFGVAHHTGHTAFSGLATLGLYVRSHWLRMPLRLLLPHLARKSWQRRVETLLEKPDAQTLPEPGAPPTDKSRQP